MVSSTKKGKQPPPKKKIYDRKPQELAWLLSQLDSFSYLLSYGFSDNNWTTANRLFQGIQNHLMPDDRERLACIWRDAYTTKDQTKTLADLEDLKAKLNNT